MAKPNGRGGWDITDEEAQAVIDASRIDGIPREHLHTWGQESGGARQRDWETSSGGESTTTNDLTDFLRARLDEDEQAARAAARCAGAYWVDSGSVLLALTSPKTDECAIGVAEATDYRYDDVLGHAARHEPDRVLRRVEANRAILERHYRAGKDHWDPGACVGCGWTGDPDSPRTWYDDPCPELADLASAYDDHPDYRQEWRRP